jgi:hypothetical protein
MSEAARLEHQIQRHTTSDDDEDDEDDEFDEDDDLDDSDTPRKPPKPSQPLSPPSTSPLQPALQISEDKSMPSAEAEDKAKLEAEAEDRAKLAAEAEDKAKLAAEAEDEAKLAAEAEDKARLAAEAEDKAKLAAEAEDKAKLAAEAEDKAKLAAEVAEANAKRAEEKASLAEQKAAEAQRMAEEAEQKAREAQMRAEEAVAAAAALIQPPPPPQIPSPPNPSDSSNDTNEEESKEKRREEEMREMRLALEQQNLEICKLRDSLKQTNELLTVLTATLHLHSQQIASLSQIPSQSPVTTSTTTSASPITTSIPTANQQQNKQQGDEEVCINPTDAQPIEVHATAQPNSAPVTLNDTQHLTTNTQKESNEQQSDGLVANTQPTQSSQSPTDQTNLAVAHKEEEKESEEEEEWEMFDLYESQTNEPAIASAAHRIEVSGRWFGDSAGGCFNNASWWLNPQFVLSLKSASVVTVRLRQPRGSAHAIGFYVLEAGAGGRRAFNKEDLVDKCAFDDTNEVYKSLNLSAGLYALVPCTYESAVHSSFTLIAEVNPTDDPIELKAITKESDWKIWGVKGRWTAKSAGGCRNYASHFDNHQLLLRGSSRKVTVIVMQHERRDFDDLGIYVVRVASDTQTKVVSDESALVAKSQFYSPFESSVSFGMQQDSLAIVPCTFEPQKFGRFRVFVIASDALDVSVLRPPPFVQIQGAWTQQTAGGCLNHTTWRSNPQYQLKADGRVTVRLSLPFNRAALNTSDAERATIGFYLLKSDGSRQVEVTKDNFVSKVTFTQADCVAQTIQLPTIGGIYTLIPCTFKPSYESKFNLQVYQADGGAGPLWLREAHQRWHQSSVSSQWRGVTAGGCMNHSTWRNNPQFSLSADEDGEAVLVLQQLGSDAPKSIGLYVVPCPSSGLRAWHVRVDDIIRKAAFRKSREVSCRLALEAGLRYNVIACAFSPLDFADFQLQLFCDQPTAQLKQIEEQRVEAEGQWDGPSAGGCMNEPTFMSNPHFLLSVCGDRPIATTIVLSQSLLEAKSEEDLQPIGFYVTRADSFGFPQVAAAKDVLGKAEFERSHDVALTIELKPSTTPYVITPTTFFPSISSSFRLFVYSADSSKLCLSPSPANRQHDPDYDDFLDQLHPPSNPTSAPNSPIPSRNQPSREQTNEQTNEQESKQTTQTQTPISQQTTQETIQQTEQKQKEALVLPIATQTQTQPIEPNQPTAQVPDNQPTNQQPNTTHPPTPPAHHPTPTPTPPVQVPTPTPTPTPVQVPAAPVPPPPAAPMPPPPMSTPKAPASTTASKIAPAKTEAREGLMDQIAKARTLKSADQRPKPSPRPSVSFIPFDMEKIVARRSAFIETEEENDSSWDEDEWK